jgi:hypothetical protein
MDQLPLEDFENSSVRSFDVSKYSKCLFLSKVGLLWEECLIMGKRGSFWIFDQFLLEYLSLCLNKCVWLRDRNLSLQKTNRVVAKNDPNMPNLNQKNKSWSHLHWCCASMCCFLLCWHKSPKRGRLKGKCALGPFLSILVIKCPTQMA